MRQRLFRTAASAWRPAHWTACADRLSLLRVLRWVVTRVQMTKTIGIVREGLPCHDSLICKPPDAIPIKFNLITFHPHPPLQRSLSITPFLFLCSTSLSSPTVLFPSSSSHHLSFTTDRRGLYWSPPTISRLGVWE
jgi:hypothetical protein